MEEVGSGAASKWPGAAMDTQAEHVGAAVPGEVGYKATDAQAQLPGL